MSAEVAKALPPSILALFAPRPPIEFKPPVKKGKARPYTGVGALLGEFESRDESAAAKEAWRPYVTLIERRAKAKAARKAAFDAYQLAARERYDPGNDDERPGDPFRTIFVGRLGRARCAARCAASERGRVRRPASRARDAKPRPCV